MWNTQHVITSLPLRQFLSLAFLRKIVRVFQYFELCAGAFFYLDNDFELTCQ
jgi:hypothetical protein